MITYGSNPTVGSFKLREVDNAPIFDPFNPANPHITSPGKSVSLPKNAIEQNLVEEFYHTFGEAKKIRRGDILSKTTAGDIRAAGFDVIYAPTHNSLWHLRIVEKTRTFDEIGREWLSSAFKKVGKIKKSID